MENKVIVLSEYEEKDIIIKIDDWNLINKQSQYYKVQRKDIISPNNYLIGLQAKFYIGLIKLCPSIDLIIRPKISSADFLAMLKYVDEKKINTWKILINSIEKEKNFIDYFVRLFLEEVYELLINSHKKGYFLKKEKLRQPKGKILVNDTIKSFKPNEFLIFCQNFEFSLNIPHNQLIKYTLYYIKDLISLKNYNIYYKSLQFLKDVKLFKWNSSEIAKLTYNRLTLKYKPIHELCLLILEDFSLKFEKGKDRFFSFVINSWNVYEIFLREIYTKFQSKFNVSAYKITDLSDTINWEIKTSRPDLILKKNGKDILYIDAKYKVSDTKGDYNQIITYLTQIQPGKALPYGELIYPMESEDIIDYIKEGNQIVKIRYINLKRASDKEYIRNFVDNTLKECQKYI